MSIGRRIAAGDALPAWFSSGLFSVLVWCATAGITALVLLCVNAYNPATCAVIATALTVAAWFFRPRSRPDAEPAHGASGAALAIVLVFLVLSGVFHSEHLLTDRDPSVYINTGRSIARTHRMHPTIAPSPFDDTHAFTMKTAGFAVARHHLFANFFHFLPALLALGWSVGGDTGLLLVPPLLGALALLALYALATSIVGPRWALLGPVLLGLAPLQAWFSRDAYAELPLELLALGGIWLFIETRREGGPVSGAIAGAILGSIIFVRIDALAILVALPIVFAVEHLRASALATRSERRRSRAHLAGFAIALVATMVAGTAVSRRLSQGYLNDLQHNLLLLELAFAAAVVIAVGIFVVHHYHAGLGHRLASDKRLIWAGGATTIAIALYAYFLRPRTGGAPTFEMHAANAGTARKALNAYYYSSSFRWFSWYFGFALVAFAVVGFVVLGVRAVRGDSPALILLATAIPVTLIYVARPSIAPDHLWAMRRYLPIVLPGMMIAAAAAAICCAAAIEKRQPRLRAPFVVIAVAAMVVPAAISGIPLLEAQMQGGALAAIHKLCKVTGDDAAIAIEPYALLGTELPQTVRGFCGVPSAGLQPGLSTPLTTYARAWKGVGRRFYVVTAAEQPLLAAAPNAVKVAHLTIRDTREPDRTLGQRPDEYAPRQVDMWVYRVDPV